MSWADEAEASRRQRVLRLERILPAREAEALVNLTHEELAEHRRTVTEVNAALRARDLAGPLRPATISGRAAAEHLDRLDELERRSRDLELLELYADVLGLPIAGVGHRPGYPA